MPRTDDLRIREMKELTPPSHLIREFACGEGAEQTAANFNVGGSGFRGFSVAGIGPRDVDTDDALGGNIYGVGTLELAFPLGLPEEYPIRGRLFTDFGTLAETDADEGDIVDNGSLRASTGAGLTWRSPFGPLSVDIAIPVAKEDFDNTEFFRFSAGTRF